MNFEVALVAKERFLEKKLPHRVKICQFIEKEGLVKCPTLPGVFILESRWGYGESSIICLIVDRLCSSTR